MYLIVRTHAIHLKPLANLRGASLLCGKPFEFKTLKMSKIKTLLNGIMVVMIFSGCANIAHPDDEHTLSGKVKPHNHLTPLSATDSAGFVSKNIVVKGEVEHVLTLTVDSLRRMKTYTFTP